MPEILTSTPYLVCDNIALGPEHSNQFREIFAKAFNNDAMPSILETRQHLRAIFEENDPLYNPNDRVVGVIDDSNCLVATACLANLRVSRARTGIKVHVRNFCRKNDNNTKGVGALLLGAMYKSAIATASASGLNPYNIDFCLNVKAENSRMCKYYGDHGFIVTGKGDDYSIPMHLVTPISLMSSYAEAKAKFAGFSEEY